jgi:hypothetical protein
MHDLHLNEEMDAKMPSHAQHNNQVRVQNMYLSNMTMQYSNSHAGYNTQVQADTHSFPHSAQFSFGPCVTSFAHPFSVFDALCSPQGDSFGKSMASNNAGFPYEYREAFPSTSMSDNSNTLFHGLPLDPNANY